MLENLLTQFIQYLATVDSIAFDEVFIDSTKRAALVDVINENIELTVDKANDEEILAQLESEYTKQGIQFIYC